jgi:hypothetical protein
MIFLDSEDQLTDKELRTFEKKYNFTLPQSYRNLILKFNGGFPEKPFFKDDEIYFTPITHGEMTIERLLDVMDKSYLPEGYFPFAEADEITYCIDTKSNSFRVYRLDEDGTTTELSVTFDDFMDAITDDVY